MHENNNIRVAEEISVRKFYDIFKDTVGLEVIGGAEGFDRMILEPAINRPALAITGFFKNFASSRIQLFGAGEMAYMRNLSDECQTNIMEEIISNEIPCIVISRNLVPTKPMLDAVNKHRVPLMRTKLRSKEFSSEIAVRLDRLFAPRTSLHGTLLDIKGIGTLIRGDSGIGKSECALALIDHGHSLVADDLVYCQKINDEIVLGKGFTDVVPSYSSAGNKYYMTSTEKTADKFRKLSVTASERKHQESTRAKQSASMYILPVRSF